MPTLFVKLYLNDNRKKSDGINLAKHVIEICGWYFHDSELCAIKWCLEANELSSWIETEKT